MVGTHAYLYTSTCPCQPIEGEGVYTRSRMKPVIKSVEGKSNPVLGPEDGVPNYVMLWVQHPPGGSSAQHVHPWEHQAYIVEGEGVVWVEGEEYPIKAGDAVLVPPDVEHQFRNRGAGTLSRVTVNPLSSVGKE